MTDICHYTTNDFRAYDSCLRYHVYLYISQSSRVSEYEMVRWNPVHKETEQPFKSWFDGGFNDVLRIPLYICLPVIFVAFLHGCC